MTARPSWHLALPMYNVSPDVALAWKKMLAAVIAGLQQRGWREAMEIVTPPDDLMPFWRGPDVLLTQTCGYPFVTQLTGDVQLLATPEFDVAGCDGVNYRSVIVVRDDSPIHSLESLRGKVAAVNQPDSQSGMNALRHIVAPLAHDGVFFSHVLISGAHLASLAAVQRGDADVAAIDCVTYALATEYAAHKVAGLRVLQTTVAIPGLPLIGSRLLSEAQVAQLRECLMSLVDSEPELMKFLKLKRFTVVGSEAYQIIADQVLLARQLGYPEIA